MMRYQYGMHDLVRLGVERVLLVVRAWRRAALVGSVSRSIFS